MPCLVRNRALRRLNRNLNLKFQIQSIRHANLRNSVDSKQGFSLVALDLKVYWRFKIVGLLTHLIADSQFWFFHDDGRKGLDAAGQPNT